MLTAPAFALLVLAQSAAPDATAQARAPSTASQAGAGATGAEPQRAAEERRPPVAPDLPLEQRAPDGDGAFVWQMLRSLLALFAVLGLIYLLFKVGLAKFLQGTVLRAGKHVTVLERVPLDARHALYVVELAGGRRLLLGSTERGISVVESLTEPRGAAPAFADVLEKTRSKEGSDA